MRPARAIVFDFNGTLSHDEPVLYAIYADLFEQRGRPLREADYYGRLAGNSEEAIIGGWLGVEGAELEALVDERIERYVRLADGATVPPAVRRAVEHAARRVPVAVVSGAFRREIEPVLAGAGIREAVSVIVAADDVDRGKPDPQGYRRVVELLGGGLVADDLLAFEDTEAGVAAARGAGLRCVAVRGTHPDERLTGAERIVDSIDPELVGSLIG
jgi:HAD superfamily hydrolase (TIGR01509 family)